MIHFKLFLVLFVFSSAGLTGIARASYVVIYFPLFSGLLLMLLHEFSSNAFRHILQANSAGRFGSMCGN